MARHAQPDCDPWCEGCAEPAPLAAATVAVEDQMLTRIATVTSAKVIKYEGQMTLIDAYAVRDHAKMAEVEAKHRHHAHDRYPTILLDAAKWDALCAINNGPWAGTLWVQYDDGWLGWVKPSTLIPVTRQQTTPSAGSRSLNRGRQRETVTIPRTAFVWMAKGW
jgi:hypothetical protein